MEVLEPESHQDMEAFYKVAKYPLVRSSDMTIDSKQEAIDICVTATEKYPADMEKCTQVIKESMDKKFGSSWHVVVGKYFSYNITYECKNMLYLFVGEPLECWCGKCEVKALMKTRKPG